MNKESEIYPTGQRIPNGMLEDNYPRNMWWVAAHSREVTEKPLARWLLETPVVLYRLADGTPAALYDRCVLAIGLLLAHGADANRVGNDYGPPLIFACEGSALDTMAFLLSRGAQITGSGKSLTKTVSWNALKHAAFFNKGCPGMLKLLLDPSATDTLHHKHHSNQPDTHRRDRGQLTFELPPHQVADLTNRPRRAVHHRQLIKPMRMIHPRVGRRRQPLHLPALRAAPQRPGTMRTSCARPWSAPSTAHPRRPPPPSSRWARVSTPETWSALSRP